MSYRWPARITMHAHRMALILAGVEIPEGHDALHKCNVRDCVRVHRKHVYHGTVSRNMLDRLLHGTDPNRRKTHCPQGHPYNKVNTLWIRAGKARVCRTCLKFRNERKRG